MAKYKIKHTSIMHNGKVYAEGAEIELTDNQAKRLEDFVELINSQLVQKPAKTQTVKMTVKTKTDSKSETGADKKDGEDVTEGGTDGE